MEYSGESFLKILNDDSPISYGNATSVSQNSSIKWDDDDDSFEVSEVTNVASSDQSLADALRSIDTTTQELQNVRSPSVSFAPAQPGINRQTSLKEELKAKIQTRRKSQGVGELRVKFEPPKSYALTNEEKVKVEKRKHRNRLSANKSRQRRKELEDTLEKEVNELQKTNDELSKEVKFLRKVKHLLHLKLENHQCTKRVAASSQTYEHAFSNGNVTTSATSVCTRESMTSSSLGKITLRSTDGHTGGRTILTKSSTRCFEPLTV